MLHKYTKVNKSAIKKQASRLEGLSRIDPRYIAVMMAIRGDVGDDVPGVDGVGPTRLIDLFSKVEVVEKLIGSPKEMEDRVKNGGKIFREDQIGIGSLPKLWQKVFLKNDLVTMSYKLISFESLCNWLEDATTTEKIEHINYINKILTKENVKIVPSPRSFHTSLSHIEDLYLTEETIQEIFMENLRC